MSKKQFSNVTVEAFLFEMKTSKCTKVLKTPNRYKSVVTEIP